MDAQRNCNTRGDDVAPGIQPELATPALLRFALLISVKRPGATGTEGVYLAQKVLEAEAWNRPKDFIHDMVAMVDAVRVFQAPRVKSGNSTGALPFATEATLRGPTEDHAAVS